MLAVLLYATFTQVLLSRLRSAFAYHHFLAALLTGSFVLIPALVAMLTLRRLAPGRAGRCPDRPAVAVGLLDGAGRCTRISVARRALRHRRLYQVGVLQTHSSGGVQRLPSD